MHNAIDFMVENGYMKGTSETTFAPYANMTRGQIVETLYRISGEDASNGSVDYTDVNPDAYYYDALVWATENHIVSGFRDGTFRAYQQISRQDLAVFLYRFNNVQEDADDSVLDSFADQNRVSAYAREPMAWAVANGLISGFSETQLAPRAAATRGQAAAILYRSLA